MIFSLLALATLASTQNAPGLTTNPGGATPVGLSRPNITGFQQPVILPARGGYAICVSGTIPVTASATNQKLNFSAPVNQSQIVDTTLNVVSAGSTLMTSIAAGMANVSGTYNISGTLCQPANGTRSSTIQILTHGIGFDRYYWDFAPGYSYADYAAIKGYATFFYDRLGVGKSSKPDGIATLQTPLEVAIATQLVRLLRNGSIGGSWKRVVGVGHSFGSVITQAITNSNPQLLDAAILTGFTTDMAGMPAFLTGLNLAIASQTQPYRFAALNSSYLVSGSATSDQIGFLKSPNFDPEILAMAQAQKGTVTWGEFLTVNSVVKPAFNFTGPVAIVNGDADLPFCQGNCTYPADKTLAARAALFPVARNVTGNQTFLAPLTGHGINLHYTATRAYDFIQNFIAAANL